MWAFRPCKAAGLVEPTRGEGLNDDMMVAKANQGILNVPRGFTQTPMTGKTEQDTDRAAAGRAVALEIFVVRFLHFLELLSYAHGQVCAHDLQIFSSLLNRFFRRLLAWLRASYVLNESHEHTWSR